MLGHQLDNEQSCRYVDPMLILSQNLNFNDDAKIGDTQKIVVVVITWFEPHKLWNPNEEIKIDELFAYEL